MAPLGVVQGKWPGRAQEEGLQNARNLLFFIQEVFKPRGLPCDTYDLYTFLCYLPINEKSLYLDL